MNAYSVNYQWEPEHQVPILHIVVTGALPGHTLPALIDRAHAWVDQSEYHAACLVYDITGTPGRLPLAALMRRGRSSPKVRRAAVIGAGSRSDEMAVLIMASARHLPYEIGFFRSLADAAGFLNVDEVAQAAYS